MKLKILIAIAIFISTFAFAGVNPKNGNFFITYQDISLKKEGRELDIRRTYNSISTGVGWFGFGWGSKYDTKILVLPDGSAAIIENGSGRVTYYRTGDEAAIRAGVQRIVKIAKEKEKLTSDAADDLAKKLIANEELRLSKTIKYSIQSELQNAEYLVDECGKGNLTRIPDGYRRKDCNRFGDIEVSTDTFDTKGRLVRREFQDGYATMLSYSEANKANLHDTLGQSLAVTWNNEGRVLRVVNGQRELTYSYENQDLTEFKDSAGFGYTYTYDKQHNLTNIRVFDGSSVRISYYNGRTEVVTERDGSRHTYEYETDPNNSKVYSTTRTDISYAGEIAKRVFTFEDRTSPSGVSQPSRIAIQGAQGANEIIYDDKGQIASKTNPDGSRTEFIRHPRSNKIILILQGELRTEFHYNEKGKLIEAVNTRGKVVGLIYTPNSDLIASMLFSENAGKLQRELKFQYNAAGHPTKITLTGAGQIDVEYGEQGKIVKVDSKQGGKMALEVMKLFQDLLDIVSEAGVRF